MHSQSEIFARAIKTLYEIKIDLIEIIHEDADFANEEPDLIVKNPRCVIFGNLLCNRMQARVGEVGR